MDRSEGRAGACSWPSAGCVAESIAAGTPCGSIAVPALGGSVPQRTLGSIGCGSTWACAVAVTSYCAAHERGSCTACRVRAWRERKRAAANAKGSAEARPLEQALSDFGCRVCSSGRAPMFRFNMLPALPMETLT